METGGKAADPAFMGRMRYEMTRTGGSWVRLEEASSTRGAKARRSSRFSSGETVAPQAPGPSILISYVITWPTFTELAEALAETRKSPTPPRKLDGLPWMVSLTGGLLPCLAPSRAVTGGISRRPGRAATTRS